MKIWLFISIFIVLMGSIGTAKYLYDHNQELKTELALKEAQNAAIANQAKRYANKPKSNDDFTRRVCAWADTIERNQGKPKSRVSKVSCP